MEHEEGQTVITRCLAFFFPSRRRMSVLEFTERCNSVFLPRQWVWHIAGSQDTDSIVLYASPLYDKEGKEWFCHFYSKGHLERWDDDMWDMEFKSLASQIDKWPLRKTGKDKS